MMKVLVVVLAAFSFAIADSNVDPDLNITTQLNNSKILGGQLAPIQRFPWQVAILKNDKFWCNGVAIGPQVILTSAACILPIRVIFSNVTIRVDSSRFDSGGRLINDFDFIIHPDYKLCANCFDYDIAVMKWSAYSGIRVTSIPLWNAYEFFAGTRSTITGWGKTTIESEINPVDLRSIDLPLVARERCNAVYGPRAICVQQVKGRGVCSDAGSPLVIDGRLAGISAYSNGCGRPGKSVVFTSVPALRDWIRTNAVAPSVDQQVLNIKIPPVQQHFDDLKIVGGFTADIKELPWQVALLLNGTHYCGGTLIASKVVLTAAHCLAPSLVSNVAKLGIRCGSTYRNRGGLVIAASRFIVHPRYKDKHCDTCVPYFDIGVIHLAAEAVVPGLPTATIPLWGANANFPVGTLARISGWGKSIEGGHKSFQLRRVDVPVRASTDCSHVYGSIIDGTKTICAGYSYGGKDACQGDSGGPFVIQDKLVGVISFGKGCARPETPAVYTSVAGYRAWIKIYAGV